MIFNKVLSIFGFFFGLIKRSMCCFRRRRKPSTDVVPLTDIGIVPTYKNQQSGPELSSWNSWDDNIPRQPQTIEEHIEHYRSSRTAALKPKEEPPQPDFFQDMEPKLKVQPKITLRRTENTQISSMLSYVPDDVPNDSGELKSWEEVENREGDWAGGAENWTMSDALRQSRREEKIKKHRERENRRTVLP